MALTLPTEESIREELWHEILNFEECTSQLRNFEECTSQLRNFEEHTPQLRNFEERTPELLEEEIPPELQNDLSSILEAVGLGLDTVKPFRILSSEFNSAKVAQTIIHSSKSFSLVQYGVEVRHLPLVGQLPGAATFVSSRAWALARDELKFSRCFNRVIELRQANTWTTKQSESVGLPRPRNTHWDVLLEEAWFMARDFEQESLWKRSMAKILAEEAKLSKGQRYVGNSSFFHKLSREMIREEGDRIYGAGSGIRQTCPIVPTIKNISDYETVSTLLPDPTLMPSCPHPSEKRHYTEWTPIEDAFVSLLLRQFTMNSLKTISEITNFTFHNKRNVRLPSDIKRRCGHLHSHEPQAKHRAKYHLDRIALMNSVHTKLIASKPPVVTKKLNMVAHPSHEAAARKANQNISKLLTPQELAMRRIQRTRIVTDPSGVIMTVPPGGAQNTNSLPRTSIPMPPGSPNQRPMNPTAAYQAAVAAASAVRPLQGSPSGSTQGMRPTAPQQPGATSIRPPMPPVPNAAINQQQRQTLLNRSHQIGNYIATMQARPGGSPLLRPPAVDVSPSVVTMARTPTPPPPTALPTGNSPNRTPQKKRNSTNKQG